MYTCMYIYIYIYMYIYTHTHVYVYIYIYTHIAITITMIGSWAPSATASAAWWSQPLQAAPPQKSKQ